MFQKRRNSQKPADELYSSFRQNFPGIRTTTTTAAELEKSSTASMNSGLPDAAVDHRGEHLAPDHDQLKDPDTTPKGMHEPWRFTPSLMDVNSFAFTSFANQPPGYYTPTPGGTNTLYHHTAGDLHTPTLGMSIGTPLSLPTSASSLQQQVTAMDMHGFHAPSMHPHQFQNFNHFTSHDSFAPSHFSHHPAGFDQMEDDADGDLSPTAGFGLDSQVHESPTQPFSSHFESTMGAPPIPTTEKFRFHVTLNAPTAMIRHTDEIPITYLNKGQAYSMSITDTAPPLPSAHSGPVRYRTFVRISFEDEQQRQKPGACWQLWKEGRGTNEAHQRGGKLQAVEYVEASSAGNEDAARTKAELETASFDGFSVFWTAGPNGAADCSVAVRFNFLSTDFSHSKGVKGIPVRLCAKTEVVPSDSLDPTETAEICFCKVKLFRDHGAERKLSNDVAHVKKTIDKLKQQIAQVESGVKDSGKRKRNSMVAKPLPSKIGKAPKHKRTWSLSSVGSGGRSQSADDDLYSKLATVQDMFTSTRPVSVLFLRGADLDDPDLFPVRLSGEPADLTKVSLDRQDSWDRRESGGNTVAATASSMTSPSMSSVSFPAQAVPATSFSAPASIKKSPQQVQFEWTHIPVTDGDVQSSNPQLASPPDQIVKVPRAGAQNNESLAQFIEATGIDSSYRPPVERTIRPVACFYILQKATENVPSDPYYRAIYLMRRTVKDFVNGVATKCGVEPTRILQTTHVHEKGLQVLVDDDVINELPEGQDMLVEFHFIESKPVATNVSEVIVDGIVDQPESSALQDNNSAIGYEMRLFY